MEKDKIIQAGKIASEVVAYSKSFIQRDMLLLEIAEKIEDKIKELGGKPAFPVNLSIDEVAAHYTPSHDDTTKAYGLLKIDFGAHIDGWCSDTAFSIDLENLEENKKIIHAAEQALENVTKILKENISTDEIGSTISQTIESKGLSPIVNLGGHGMEEHEVHTSPFIPNTNTLRGTNLPAGLYAIEPFATNGNGRVKDGKPSGIYELHDTKNVRSPLAREILDYIIEEYETLPFCSRWLVKKFGTKALFALKQLEQNENLHQFPQLIESGKGKVAQAEHTFLIEKDKVTITTKA